MRGTVASHTTMWYGPTNKGTQGGIGWIGNYHPMSQERREPSTCTRAPWQPRGISDPCRHQPWSFVMNINRPRPDIWHSFLILYRLTNIPNSCHCGESLDGLWASYPRHWPVRKACTLPSKLSNPSSKSTFKNRYNHWNKK